MIRPALRYAPILLALPLVLAGCSERGLFREDKIVHEAGNASAANQAMMAVDMSPRAAKRKRIDHNGNRLLKGQKAYEENAAASKAENTAASPEAEQGDDNLVDDL